MVKIGSLEIADEFVEFVADELLAGTGVTADRFWTGFEAIVADLGPRNAANLAHRDALQEQIDDWHRAHRDGAHDHRAHDHSAYMDFLRSIGYLTDQPANVTVATENVDREIASLPGPQLVVPLDNARYALNAAMPAGAASMTRSTAPT